MSFDPGNTISLLIGKRKTGKTPFVLGDTKVPIEGLIPTYLAKDMKVLFIDTIDHPSYRHIPVIKPEQLRRWKKGVYRCFVNRVHMEELLTIVSEHFWNGLLVLEDAYKHQRKTLTPACAALIGDSKQHNVDMIFMYHTWKFVPLDLYAYLDYIEVFKTNRLPGKREEEELADNFDLVLAAAEKVKADPNQFAHKTVCVTQ